MVRHPDLYWHCHACPLGSVYVEWLCMNCSDPVYHYSHCCGVMLGNECHYELQNVSAMFRVD